MTVPITNPEHLVKIAKSDAYNIANGYLPARTITTTTAALAASTHEDEFEQLVKHCAKQGLEVHWKLHASLGPSHIHITEDDLAFPPKESLPSIADIISAHLVIQRAKTLELNAT